MSRFSRVSLVLISIVLLALSMAAQGTQKTDFTQQRPLVGSELSLNQVGEKTLMPSSGPELLHRLRTKTFIHSTQSVSANNATNIDQIYYRLATLYVLDSTLSMLTPETKSFWISQVKSFQSSTGGFGTWKRDYSSVSSTFKAVQVLEWLGDTTYNKTAVKFFLDRLYNNLTGGFVSHLRDSDSDVYSSYLAVKTYNLLGATLPNVTATIAMFQRAQNLNPDPNTTIVPTNEEGGFGAQTNNVKNIYWTSEAIITRAAVEALQILGATPLDASAVVNFLQGLETTQGGFVNTWSGLSMSASYTEAAVHALSIAGSQPPNVAATIQYLQSLERADGGYAVKETVNRSSLKGTYFAVRSLVLLGSGPANLQKTMDYLTNWVPSEGGFGGEPGATPSLRETFDAVNALVLMNETIPNQAAVLAYVDSYRNADGGYGLTGSYVESTLRAVEIYNLLGVPFPNAQQTISFLQGLQQPDGGFSKGAGKTVTYVISTYRAIRALSLLGAAPALVSDAVAYLKSCQNADGGFGGFPGDTSDVSSTYRAIRALEILGDSSYNVAGAIQFLKDSQVADGGFKRSVNDVVLPKNVSNAIYTYAAVRALNILGEKPNNVSGVFDFIASTRNRDGGFAEHPKFTSNIAYTFTSLWVLSALPEVSAFAVTIPDNLDMARTSYSGFNVSITGGIAPYTVLVTIPSTGQTLVNTTITSESTIFVDTSSFANGTYIVHFEVVDRSGMVISADQPLLIGGQVDQPVDTPANDTTTTPTTPLPASTPAQDGGGFVSFEYTAVVLGLLSLSVVTILKRRKR